MVRGRKLRLVFGALMYTNQIGIWRGDGELWDRLEGGLDLIDDSWYFQMEGEVDGKQPQTLRPGTNSVYSSVTSLD